MIAGVILVQSGDDGITFFSHQAVELLFACSNPVGYLPASVVGVSQYVANIEITVSQRFSCAVLVYPVIVHAECAENKFPVMLL